jgi:FkbM family methyltransferase
MKYSIVIPTYNHCTDLLKPCIESIKSNTDLSQVEIIIVANGCTDNTEQYVKTLGKPFKLIKYKQALGYPKAVNEGIKKAKGEYVVLLNNDTIILGNNWLQLLTDPFDNDANTGITGPVKFTWDCGIKQYECMAFWLVMMKRSLFDELGMLDEIFSPGMGEDGDFCIKTINAGYKLTAVPEDVAGHFNTGIVSNSFPIFHVGNGTFADNHDEKNAIIERNHQHLVNKYGKKVDYSIIVPTARHFHNALKIAIDAILLYTDLTNKEIIVVANGSPIETRNYLTSLNIPELRIIWFDEPIGYVRAVNAGIDVANGDYIITIDDDSFLQPQKKDDWINILKKPFADPLVGGSSPFANPYEGLNLVLHSGCTMYDAKLLRDIGKFDEIYNPGYFSDSDVSMKIWNAGRKCVEVPENFKNKKYDSSLGVFGVLFPVVHMGDVETMNKNTDIDIVKRNREILYSRYGKKSMKKYSIVIPTYNHCDDLLKPCIESIQRYSDMSTIQLIVVANGCTDNTKEYLTSLGDQVETIWFDEAIGYTRATNAGIKIAKGEYTILLNNDTELLPQSQNHWLNMLVAPFTDSTVGMTGPLMLHDDYSDADVLIFFCVMIKTEMFSKIGILDEIYSPGGGEDIDFSIRMKNAGYKITNICETEFIPEKSTNAGDFPIWHKDNQTFKHIPEYTNHIVKRNGLINCKKYNKNIKLNLGSGGISYSGYLSVDMYDKRAHVSMDITKLDFEENSVSEILASHVFEHLNPYHGLNILSDWLAILKPGGKLIMEMPNIEELCKRFVNASSTGEKYGILNAVYGSVNTTGVGGPDNITSPHLFGWWPQSMFDHLANAGYTNIYFMDEKIPHPESNFRVEAQKPLSPTSIPNINHEFLKQQEPNTYIEIFEQNTYAVEPKDVRNKTVIDIGANLGMFSLRCVEWGARRVISVEAQPTVYELGLVPNVSGIGHIVPRFNAVYDVDGLFVHVENHHVGSKVGDVSQNGTPTITLKTLLDREGVYGNDLVLKLDCEGSEFNILHTCDQYTLSRFNKIFIELHGGGCNPKPEYQDINSIRELLNDNGFTRVHSVNQYAYTDKGPIIMDDIAVEKWVK